MKIEPWMPPVASRLGLTAEQYAARIDAGERWCTDCGKWHPKAAFGRDRSRRSGYAARCTEAAATRHALRKPRLRAALRVKREGGKVTANRSAWVAVGGDGVPVAVWPGRAGAEQRARLWIRTQERDDLRAVPLDELRLPRAA